MNEEEEIIKSIKEVSEKIMEGKKSSPITEYEWKNISYKLNKILEGE